MAGVASKNLFDLLGNTSDDDPDKIPAPPTAPVDKTLPRKGKRNDASSAAPKDVPGAAAAAPRAGSGATGGGRGGGASARGGRYTGNEQAFRDREAGRSNNRSRPNDESGRGARGPRGGRGAARPRPYDDRHSKGIGAGPNDHAKQAAHGWGEDTGAGEWKDEQVGEQIANDEAKQGFDAVVEKPVNAEGEHPATDEPEPEPEPEDKTKSYADYLAEQAEKKLALGGSLSVRRANEGAGKKLPEGKELSREDGAEYFAGSGGKARRERERKEKNIFVLDHDIQARERESASRGGRGGRGRGRGDSFRGGERGERGGRGGGGRARGEGRGDYYRGGGERPSRGGRGGPSINVGDTSAFPSLGA